MEENYEQRIKALEDRLTNIEQKLDVIASMQGQQHPIQQNAPYMQQNVQPGMPIGQQQQPVQPGMPMGQQQQPMQHGMPMGQQSAPYGQPYPQQFAQGPGQPQPQPFAQGPVQPQPYAQGPVQPHPYGQAPGQPMPPLQTPPGQARNKDRDMESFIGRDVFVVIAAVLVFIGFIYFAGAIFPFLSKEVWFAIMCVASITLTAVSYVFARKKKNRLPIALLACGLGTIYITLFIGKFYFRMVNTFILFAALILLMLAVYHCSKYKALLFNIIGQAGILISLIMCLRYAFAEGDLNFAMYALIYVAISEVSYDLLFGEKGYLLNTLSMLFALIVLSLPVFMTVQPGIFIWYKCIPKTLSDIVFAFDMQLVGLILIMLMFVYIVIRSLVLTKTGKITTNKYGAINIVAFITYLLSMSLLENTLGVSILMMSYILLTMVVAEIALYDKKRTVTCHVFWDILLFAFMLIYIKAVVTVYVPSIILVLPLVVYAYATKSTFGKHTIYAGMLFATLIDLVASERFFDPSGNLQFSSISFYMTAVLICLILFVVLFIYKDRAPKYVKIASYLVTFGYLYMQTYIMTGFINWKGEEVWGAFVVVALLGITCLIQYPYKYICGYSLCEKPCVEEGFIIQTVFNELVLLWALFTKLHKIADVSAVAFGGAVVCIIALALFNSTLLLKQKNTAWGLFVGIQSTLVLCVIMSAFNDWEIKGFIVSITMFVCAVLCIIVGLKFSQKYLRIYALILAMISTIKMTLFDRSLKSMIGTAISFFFCAILCFTISWIYSRIEKWAKTTA